MAMEISNAYNNVYERTYAAHKKEIDGQKKTDKVSEVKVNTTRKSSNEEYFKNLQKQVPYIKLQTGYGINTNNDGKVNVVDVSPKLLEKMQNDPKAAKEYTQRLKDVEAATKWVDNFEKSMGYTAICRNGYVDENGHFSSFAVVVRKDELNEKLRKEAQENAEKQIEKTRENTRQTAEQIVEKLEEKAEEAEDADRKIAISGGAQEENNIAKDKAERILLEKLENSENGEIYLDDDNMQMILDAAKEETRGQTDKVKNPVMAGNNFDMQI